MNEAPYHLNLSTVSRRKGQSATEKSAYNAGDRIRDRRRQETHDYRYKRKGVVAVEVSLPPGCSTELSRSDLWNAVEAKERRWDARVAREIKGALPHSLSEQGRKNVMVRFNRFLAEILDTYVMGCIHLPGRGDPRNDHFHVLFPTRTFDGMQLGKKHRFLDSGKTSRPFVIECRKTFAKLINHELQKEGLDEFVDHRSYRERGVEKSPEKHLGPKRSWRKKKMEEEIAALEAKLKTAEAVPPLSDAELEVATGTIHRVILADEKSQPIPAGPFTFDSDGELTMKPSFSRRLEASKQAEATEEPEKGKNPTLQEFLRTWSMGVELVKERRKEREKKDRERRDQQRGR